jgi:hypothetical protein
MWSSTYSGTNTNRARRRLKLKAKAAAKRWWVSTVNGPCCCAKVWKYGSIVREALEKTEDF